MNNPTYVFIHKKTFKETLHKACEKGNIEAVKQHLAEGATVNDKDHDGGSPLIYASGEGHIELSEFLIAKGADLNAKAGYPETSPLHGAASENHKEIAALLIIKGADVNLKNDEGETPLDWAEEEKNTDLADLLRKHGGKMGAELKAEGK